DGANGIPSNQPMHVVREDPEQEGLLYAGTLEAAYVSFDQGKHWQTLQQNLPATPVTDFKVHHGDLLASTMGRGFWIMDDVAPLRQLAASVTKSPRARPPDNPQVRRSRAGDTVALASMPQPAPTAAPAPAKPAAAQPAKPVIRPFEPNASV